MKYNISETQLRSIIRKTLMEAYSSMGGMTEDSDIKNLMSYINSHPEINGFNSKDFSMELFTDLLRKVSNAISKDVWNEIWHWVKNLYTFMSRGDMKNANFSYTKIVELVKEALTNKKSFYV